jgi:hypothetical protein
MFWIYVKLKRSRSRWVPPSLDRFTEELLFGGAGLFWLLAFVLPWEAG